MGEIAGTAKHEQDGFRKGGKKLFEIRRRQILNLGTRTSKSSSRKRGRKIRNQVEKKGGNWNQGEKKAGPVFS